jgi:hypothetical protein
LPPIIEKANADVFLFSQIHSKNRTFLAIYWGVPRASRGAGLPALSRAATILAIKSLRGTRPFSLAPKNKKNGKIPRVRMAKPLPSLTHLN